MFGLNLTNSFFQSTVGKAGQPFPISIYYQGNQIINESDPLIFTAWNSIRKILGLYKSCGKIFF